ncbi:MAG TPA: hypothetical protein VNS19_03350 [Acidimicrobiales bacterium]|nr:hypothetical protein [Acidimicrobiales bacterium]
MKTLQVLYVDDDKSFTGNKNKIERLWTLLKVSPIPIEVEQAATPDRALEILAARHDEFHIVIIDIFWGPRKDPVKEGISLIAEVRNSYPDLATIALTTGGDGVESLAITQGVHAVLLKSELRDDHSGLKCLETLRDALAQVGENLTPFDQKVHVPPYEGDDELLTDLPLRAVIGQMGWETLWVAVFELCEYALEKINTVSFVAPGLSGAAVLGVDVQLRLPDGTVQRRQLLIKSSKEIGALEREFAGRSRAGDLGVDFAEIRSSSVCIVNGWSFIAYDFRREASTVRSWVPTADPTRVTSAIDALIDGLIDSYSASADTVSAPAISVLRRDLLPTGRRARVLMAIDRLTPLPTRFAPEAAFDATILRHLIGKSTLVDGVELGDNPHRTVKVLSHGDLHGGNCLITRQAQPVLVDPANVGHLHWASDLARLTVDIAVMAAVTGDDVYDWAEVPRWVDVVERLGAGDPASGPDAALQRLVSGLHEVGAALAEATGVDLNVTYELHLALAFEFLRAGYRKEELSVQGRLVALCAADHHVRLAVEAFTAAGER